MTLLSYEGSKTTRYRVKLHLVFCLTPCMFTLQRQSKIVCKVQIFTKGKRRRHSRWHTHTHVYIYTYIQARMDTNSASEHLINCMLFEQQQLGFFSEDTTSLLKMFLAGFQCCRIFTPASMQAEFHISTLKCVAVSFYFRPSKPYQTNYWISLWSTTRGLTQIYLAHKPE